MSAAWWDEHPCGLARVERGISRYDVQPHILPFMELERWQGKRVLEFGCGIGEDAEQFLLHGADYMGTERSIASRSFAQGRLAHQGFASTRIRASVGILSAKFDLFYSFGVLHHLTNPEDILDIAWRTLKPDGALKLMVYRKPSWKWLQTFWRGTEASPGVPITRAYTPRAIRNLVEQAGFIDVRVWRAHYGWHLLVDAVKP